METVLHNIAQVVLPSITPIFIGCSGGIVSVILKNHKPALTALLAAAIVSGFAGYITYKLCLSASLDEHFTNAITGLGGFFGPATLNALGNHVFKRFGLDISPYLHKEDEETDDTRHIP